MTDNTRALLEQALEALTCNLHPTWIGLPKIVDAIRAELAKQKLDPAGSELPTEHADREELTSHGQVLVPIEVLEHAAEALGNFVSDHGWSYSDMQAMDNLDAYIAWHKANQARPTAPIRAYRLTMQLDADTLSDMVNALMNLSLRADRGELTRGVSGGPDSGYIYELLHDPAQTHETYFSQVREYLAHKKVGQEGGAS